MRERKVRVMRVRVGWEGEVNGGGWGQGPRHGSGWGGEGGGEVHAGGGR